MRWLFSEFVLDTDLRELCRAGTLVDVEPQVFDLLAHLIEHRDRVISRDELLEVIWHGRIVSDSALANGVNAARIAVGDTDKQKTLIRTLPRKGFRFVGTVVEEERRSTPARPTESSVPSNSFLLPEQPSIVVLPFMDMSAEQNEGHFADGMTEDLITGLARIRWLFVIARNSAFVYKHRDVDVKQVARDLGVRYVLEGSVRRSGRRIRITAQLVDAATGVHHWAERYDREVGEVFAIQDEITSNVAAAVEPQLLAAEGTRALLLPPADLGAWELVARAQSRFWRLTKSDYDAAIENLKQAIESSPDYAAAHALLGFYIVFAVHMGWLDPDQNLETGRQLAERAIVLDDRNPWGHSALGYAAMMQRRTQESIAAFQKAVDLNPSSAVAHCGLSHGFAFAGRSSEAIEQGEIAIRLSPLDPDMTRFLGGIAIGHFTARRFDDAVRCTEEQMRLRPGFQGGLRLRCASLAQSGRIEEARALMASLRRTHRPTLTVDWVRQNVPYQTPQLIELFIEGLRKAGLET